MSLAYPTRDEVKTCENVETCLRWNRFLPSPRTDNEVVVIDLVVERLRALRGRDNDAYVAASKNLGWDQ